MTSSRMGSGNSYGQAYTVALDTSNNVYIAGTVGTSSSAEVLVYWLNGSLKTLALGSGNSVGIANDVAVDGSGNVWFAGAVGATASTLIPAYWKDGTLTTLTTGSARAERRGS